MQIIAAYIIASLVVFAPASRAARASLTLTTHGEATVYVAGNFTRDFDVSYVLAVDTRRNNRSFTTIGVMMIGATDPGPSAEVGLANGYPSAKGTSGFVLGSHGHGTTSSAVWGLPCGATCTIELRGNSDHVSAYLDGRLAGTWSRSDLSIESPYIQINAEVYKEGDAISASVVTKKATAGGRALQAPICEFTTGGIEARSKSPTSIRFAGVYRSGARSTYAWLKSGTEGVTHCGGISQ
jgi:hypothetical protein